MRKKHIDFYNECVENGNQMPNVGLCTAAMEGIISNEIFEDYFVLTKQEKNRLKRAGGNIFYWLSGEKDGAAWEFTPLRQTIVLFMAAIAGEFDK